MTREADFAFIGPNCLGVYSPHRIDTLFLPAERLIQPNAGNVAFVSQSGGVMVDNMVKFTRQGIGISIAVSIGNKALIREIDMLRYLANDPQTKVIVFYIEGFENNEGRRFVLAAKAGSALDDDFLAAANVLVKSPEVDCVLILIFSYSPGISAELGARISYICKTEDKPVIAYIPNEENTAC
jgi:hypothetical protein